MGSANEFEGNVSYLVYGNSDQISDDIRTYDEPQYPIGTDDQASEDPRNNKPVNDWNW